MKISDVDLAKRIEAWQQRLDMLGIAHFRIEKVTLTDAVCGETLTNRAGAYVSPTYDTVRFEFDNDYVETCTAKQLDETILHEWIHVAMRDLDATLDQIEPWMPEATWDTFDQTLRLRRESLVDRLARQLYAFAKPRSSTRCTFQ